jgi:TonB family protein
MMAVAMLALVMASPAWARSAKAERRASAMSDDGSDLPESPSYRAWGKVIRVAIREKWLELIPPEAKAGEKGAVMLRFCVLSDGRIDGIEVLAREGPASFDAVVLMALSAASPLAPPPPGKVENGLRLTYTFHYNLNAALADHWRARAKWRTRKRPKVSCPGLPDTAPSSSLSG